MPRVGYPGPGNRMTRSHWPGCTLRLLPLFLLSVAACAGEPEEEEPPVSVIRLAAAGVPCDHDDDCDGAAGDCRDGVCCNTSCGGGDHQAVGVLSNPNDCQACSTAFG